jgi:hypothetical protein
MPAQSNCRQVRSGSKSTKLKMSKNARTPDDALIDIKLNICRGC